MTRLWLITMGFSVGRVSEGEEVGTASEAVTTSNGTSRTGHTLNGSTLNGSTLNGTSLNLHRLHAHGLVAEFPRSRRWRTTRLGRRLMATAIQIREINFPQLLAFAA